METPKSRQDAEYEMIKSIYDKDVYADDTDWLTVSITLEPLHDSQSPEVHAKITLKVCCNEYYPDKEPTIILKDSKGLSRVQIEALQKQLEDLASSLLGEVMILQLAQCVQEFLHQHNKPGTKSFYEEMLQRQKLQEQLRSQTELDKKNKEWKDIQDKLQFREPPSSDEEEVSSNGLISEQRRVRFLSDVENVSSGDNCDHRNCKYIQFGTKVLRGRCMEHDEHSVVYHGIDVSNGEPNVIREYILKPGEKQTSKKLLSHVFKQLDSIEKELQYLKRFRHENLLGYLDFKHIVERDHLVTYLVQEFVSNVSLASINSWDVSPDISFIRHVVSGLCRALAFLHQHNVLHKNISSSSVFLTKSGTVKLGNYSVTRRMEELQLSCSQIQTGGGRIKLAKGSDILQLAAMVLGLLGVPADPANRPATPSDTPPQLKDFLDKCFLPEERRWTARQLVEHDFVKDKGPPIVGPRDRRLSGTIAATDAGDDAEEDTDQLISQFKIPNDLKYQSRLSSEFRVLKYLGSGSFGKVLKAKNRLDGGIYAIKAIELNPRNKQLNRKMIREVKLLSKLNHENVVRYFNSWIETTNVDNSSSVTQVTSTPLQSLTQLESLRALEENSGVSSRKGDVAADDHDDDGNDSDDSDSDDESYPTESLQQEEPSESIVFADSGAGDMVDAPEEESEQLAEPVKQLKQLYIQMEFCEKSTLRIAIDEGGLYADIERFWRLVREIIEGLEYIHLQDMIHRDLKPVNIFLDSADHVKIGDFGLATTSVLNRGNFMMATMNQNGAESEGSSHLHTEDSHTGGVGTSFYVAPELQKQIGKTHYNKKVDIYSLGIILFEMAHPPFSTHMERCKTLSCIRQPEIVCPPTMEEEKEVVVQLVRQLLNHDPCKRPTCSELLTCSLLPPPQVEDSELQDFIRHTLSNPQSKAYKSLISSCFQQKTCVEEDVTYHPAALASERYHALHEQVRDVLTGIVRRHGARCVNTPLLMPGRGEDSDTVRLMTHSGSVVTAPRDLRVPLARQLARTGTQHLRRYCIERVYRERRTHGYHPREAWECAFDIATPTAGELLADAEMLCVLDQLQNQLPALKPLNCIIRLNHAMLLRACLLAFGLEKLYEPIFHVLNEAREGKFSRTRLESSLEEVSVNGQLSVTLASLLQREESLVKITSEILPLVKRTDESASLAKKAFDQLKLISSHAEAMGNKLPIKVCIGVVNTSHLCNGVMFDMTCSKKRKDGNDILASGCRYDELISQFWTIFDMAGSKHGRTSQAAVGMSVSIDKLVNILKEDCEDMSGASVVVCSLGQESMVRSKAEMVRGLRSAGVTSYILDNVESLEDLVTYGRENRVPYMVWLKKNEARLWSWEKERERYMEKKVPISEVVDSIVRATRSSYDSENLAAKPVSADPSTSQNFNVHIMVEDKMVATARRRYEAQIKSKMAPFLSNFSSRPSIEALGVFLDLKVIKLIAANLDFSDDAVDFTVNAQLIIEKCPKNKRYIQKICDKIHSFCSERESLVVILYSLTDDKFKQII